MKCFKNILYVFESSAEQDSSLARAVSLAENNQAVLTLIDVVAPVSGEIGSPAHELHNKLLTERRELLMSLIEPYHERVHIRLEINGGTRFIEVIRAVLRNGHDLVIKIAENPSWLERLFGSDDMHLLRKCPCPLWLMKPNEKPDYDCIMAAVDFDPLQASLANQGLNLEILELSGSLAFSDFATWHLVHAWDTFADEILKSWGHKSAEASIEFVEDERSRHQNSLDRLLAQYKEQVGTEAFDYLSPHLHLPQGQAAIVIPEMAKQLQADLVVMGTVARTGLAGFFIGNTAEAILEQLQCSVLAIKPAGFNSPVKLDN